MAKVLTLTLRKTAMRGKVCSQSQYWGGRDRQRSESRGMAGWCAHLRDEFQAGDKLSQESRWMALKGQHSD